MRERLPRGEPGRYREPVGEIALAPSEQLVVDRQHQRVASGVAGALRQLARERAIAIDEDLHPAHAVVVGRQFLDRAHRAVALAIHRGRRRRRPRGRDLAPRPEEAGQSGRPDQHGRRQRPAEQRHRLIAGRRALQRTRKEVPATERVLVAAQRHLVLGAAVGEIEDRPRQARTRRLAQQANVGTAHRERIVGHRSFPGRQAAWNATGVRRGRDGRRSLPCGSIAGG